MRNSFPESMWAGSGPPCFLEDIKTNNQGAGLTSCLCEALSVGGDRARGVCVYVGGGLVNTGETAVSEGPVVGEAASPEQLLASPSAVISSISIFPLSLDVHICLR